MIFHCCVGVCHGNHFESVIIKLFACAVQKRKIHHAVNDCPALLLAAVPCAYKSAVIIKSAHKKACGKQKPVSLFFIACQSVIIPGGYIPHKPHIVIQRIIFGKSSVEHIHCIVCGFQILLLARCVIHQNHQRRPKAVCPPCRVKLNSVIMYSVLCTVRNFVKGFHRCHGKLPVKLFPNGLYPFSVVFVYFNFVQARQPPQAQLYMPNFCDRCLRSSRPHIFRLNFLPNQESLRARFLPFV